MPGDGVHGNTRHPGFHLDFEVLSVTCIAKYWYDCRFEREMARKVRASMDLTLKVTEQFWKLSNKLGPCNFIARVGSLTRHGRFPKATFELHKFIQNSPIVCPRIAYSEEGRVESAWVVG